MQRITRKRGRRSVWFAAAGSVGLLGLSPAWGAPYTWVSTGGGLFSTASNWSPSGVPGSGDFVTFNLAAPYTVSFASDPTIISLNVNNSDIVTFNLGGRTLSTISNVIVGSNAGLGKLTLTNGAVTAEGFAVAGTGTGYGELTIGSGAVLTTGSSVEASNSSPSSAGSVVVSGAGSTVNVGLFLRMGLNGAGTLSILDGGTVNTTGNSYLGYLPGSSGTALVSGIGSTLNVNALGTPRGLFLGGQASTPGGTGALTIADGGVVNVQAETKIWNSGSSLTIDGGTLVTSRFTSLGTFNFDGGNLTATTTLSNQSAGVIAGHGVISCSTLTNDGQMQHSGGSTDVYGTVTCTSGSTITVSGGSAATYHNNVTLNSGSTFQVSLGSAAVFFDSVTGTSNFTGPGTKYFEGSTSSFTGITSIVGNTRVQSPATVNVNTVRENAVEVEGKLKTTTSGGTSVVNSLYIGSAGQFDINNNKLIVQFGTNASPLAATRSAIRNGRGGTDFGNATWQGAGGITSDAAAPGGIGDGVNGGDGISFAVGYVENSFLPQLGLPSYTSFGGQTVNSGSVLIRFTRGADCNLDGKVNTDDVTIVGALYNNAGTGEWFLGDFDYDGICDSDDVTVLGALYDATAPALSTAQLSAQYGDEFAAAFARGQSLGAAVPEPSMGVLALGGLALAGRRRRRPR